MGFLQADNICLEGTKVVEEFATTDIVANPPTIKGDDC
jgi:hypothetical protein